MKSERDVEGAGAPRRALNVFLLVALLLVLFLNWAVRRDPTQRNIEVMNEMVNSVAYESQAENPMRPETSTMLEPVAGTIARGFRPLHYAATPEDAKRAGDELVNPESPDDATAVDRGAFVFSTFCVVCHGAAGLGDGPVTKRGFPPPPSLLGENARNMKDGQIFHILTYGQRNMPSYAGQVTREDRWKAILYVRSLQKQSPAPAQGR